MRKARVLCVDDSADIRELMRRLISRESGMELVGALDSADDLCTHVEQTAADVVLIDLSMPGIEPLEAVGKLSASGSGCRILVMSGRDDPETIDRAMAAGASGFVSKDAGPVKIMAALRDIVGPIDGS